jgi:hypothetical protein
VRCQRSTCRLSKHATQHLTIEHIPHVIPDYPCACAAPKAPEIAVHTHCIVLRQRSEPVGSHHSSCRVSPAQQGMACSCSPYSTSSYRVPCMSYLTAPVVALNSLHSAAPEV